MCTLILLRRSSHHWPLLLATNRDEMLGRPWLQPARHWVDRPGVMAGLDQLAGGSWLGINNQGVVAAVLNRTGTLGSKPGMRSRGELVLESLTYTDAAKAATALTEMNPGDYRAFNLIVADKRDAFWITHRGLDDGGKIECVMLPEGLSMLTDRNINDHESPRIQMYLPAFQAASEPDPGSEGGWRSWTSLLASRRFDPMAGPGGAMTVVDGDFGTLSSSLIAIPSEQQSRDGLVWHFAAGPPDRTEYQKLSL